MKNTKTEDIVVADKRGYFVHYRIKEKTLAEWNKTAKSLLEPVKDFTIADD